MEINQRKLFILYFFRLMKMSDETFDEIRALIIRNMDVVASKTGRFLEYSRTINFYSLFRVGLSPAGIEVRHTKITLALIE